MTCRLRVNVKVPSDHYWVPPHRFLTFQLALLALLVKQWMFWSLLDFVEIKAPFIFSSILPLSETFLLLNSFLIFDSFLYFLFDLKSYIFLKLLSFLFQIHSWHIIIRTVLTCHFFSIPTMSYCTFFFLILALTLFH